VVTAGKRVGGRSDRAMFDELGAGVDRATGFKRIKAELQRTGGLVRTGDRDCTVCSKPVSKHSDPCRACGRAPEHHAPGDEDLEWEAKARLTKARLAAGVPLTLADHEAIDRFPEPRSPWAEVAV
jgi:hypothetical protein